MNFSGLKRYIKVFQDRVGLDSITARFVSGSLWSLSGNTIARAISMVSTILVTRILGKGGYGQVSIIQNTVEMFVLAGSLGLSFTATKHVAEFRNTDPQRTGRLIAMTGAVSWISGIVVTVLFFLFASWLATHSLGDANLKVILQIGSGLLLFAVVNAAQLGALSGFEAFKLRAKVNIASTLLTVPLVLAGALIGGPTGALCGMSAAALGTTCLNAWALRHTAKARGVPMTWAGWYKEAPLVLRFGIPTMASSLITMPVTWYCNTLLVRSPGGIYELGLYNAANQWFNLIMFLPSILSVVSIPILSSLIAHREWDKVSSLVRKSLKAHLLIAVPAVIMILASPILMKIYGKEFHQGSSVMSVLVATAFVVAMQSPIWPVLLAAGKLRAVIILNVVWSLVFIGVCWYSVRFGAIGLALARLSAYVIYSSGMLVLTYRLLTVPKTKVDTNTNGARPAGCLQAPELRLYPRE